MVGVFLLAAAYKFSFQFKEGMFRFTILEFRIC